MAVPAQNGPNQSLPERQKSKKALSGAEYVAVRLYAEGKTRSHVAALLADKLYGHLEDSMALKATRKKLRTWEETQWFRDAVYEYSVGITDMEIPRILAGVRRRAKAGRVDAARLVLEVTNRHNPRGESGQAAVVNISFGGAIPRPQSRIDGQMAPELPSGEVVDAEVLDEEEMPSNSPHGPTADLSAYRRVLARLRR